MSGQEDDKGLLQLKADLSELIGLTQGVRACVYVCVCVLTLAYDHEQVSMF